ncbi:uncharacterized protein EI90DRAFT_2350132 [Cantharellus anzutake]|uniref:uncharacterized protein n=1 Tax=Cantharellus anzutake TaxID=1750568 RepID=UPI00190868F5|nr:uncharacterized protein EI90DRAFT_2350132 [Cantharellus anzutake]KAF8324289.1 hypothetical protein EI90DRAFT_2350132 [Cantharellus anzutake]
MAGNDTTKLDAGLFFAGSAAHNSWGDVAVVIECKLQERRLGSDIEHQLKRAAELTFVHQFRRFVWGLSVYSHNAKDSMHHHFQLFFFTRSGIFCSEEYDLKENFSYFCKLLVGFARMTPEEHGWFLIPRSGPFHLSFDPPENFVASKAPKLSIPEYSETLHLVCALYVRHEINGRATVVLHCKTITSQDRVVKLTWLEDFRARYYRNVLDIIGGLDFEDLPKTEYREHLSAPGDCKPYSVHQSLEQFARTDISTRRGDVKNCNLYCVITDKVGVSIWKETSLSRVFSAFAEIAGQIESMEAKGLYHRDVSDGNIFTRARDQRPQLFKGWLDDFDFMYVDELGKEDSAEAGKLCGTFPFI